MEIKIKIEAPGLEGAIHTLAQVLANYEMPVKDRDCEEKIEADPVKTGLKTESKTEPEKETPKQDEPEPEKKTEPKEDKQESTISLETVKSKLVELAQAGKQKDVKALITEMGVNKLPEVPEEKYPELLEKAEALL